MSYSCEVTTIFAQNYGKTPDEIAASVKREYPNGIPREPLVLNADQYLSLRDRLLDWRRPVVVRDFTLKEKFVKIIHNPIEAVIRLFNVITKNDDPRGLRETQKFGGKFVHA